MIKLGNVSKMSDTDPRIKQVIIIIIIIIPGLSLRWATIVSPSYHTSLTYTKPVLLFIPNHLKRVKSGFQTEEGFPTPFSAFLLQLSPDTVCCPEGSNHFKKVAIPRQPQQKPNPDLRDTGKHTRGTT